MSKTNHRDDLSAFRAGSLEVPLFPGRDHDHAGQDPFAGLAYDLDAWLPPSSWLTMAQAHLLAARDSAIRARELADAQADAAADRAAGLHR